MPRLLLTALVLAASFTTLTACATPSAPAPPEPAALAPDPRLCADGEAEPLWPDGASAVRAATPVERAAMALLSGYIVEVLAWGREGWARADLAREGCDAAP